MYLKTGISLFPRILGQLLFWTSNRSDKGRILERSILYKLKNIGGINLYNTIGIRSLIYCLYIPL